MKLTWNHLSIILVALISFVQETKAQNTEVYASTTANDIIKIDPFSCSYQLAVDGMSLTQYGVFIDIAFEGDELYSCGSDGSIYKINTNTGTMQWINQSGFVSHNVSGLVGDQNGHLYLSGLSLFRYTISSNTMEDIGALGHITQGDLEIYEDDLYVAAGDSSGLPKLIKVQLDPFTVSEIGDIQNGMFGMAKFGAIGANKFLASKDSTLLVVDINSASTPILCSNIFDDQVVFGMTSGPVITNQLGLSSSESEQIKIYQKDHDVIVEINHHSGISLYSVYNTLGQLLQTGSITSGKTNIELKENYSGIMIFTVRLSNGKTVEQKLIF